MKKNAFLMGLVLATAAALMSGPIVFAQTADDTASSGKKTKASDDDINDVIQALRHRLDKVEDSAKGSNSAAPDRELQSAPSHRRQPLLFSDIFGNHGNGLIWSPSRNLLYDDAFGGNWADVNGNVQSLSVNIVNDEITVKLNGKEVPKSQIERNGDTVKILDAHGNVLHQFKVGDASTFNMSSVAFGNKAKKRPSIGIRMQPVGAALASQLELDADDVVLIGQVVEGHAADKAGLEPYDIVTDVDGEHGATMDKIAEVVSSKKEGDKIEMRVIRHGRPMAVTVTVEETTISSAGVWMGGYPQNPFGYQSGLFGDQSGFFKPLYTPFSNPLQGKPHRLKKPADDDLEAEFEKLRRSLRELEERMQKLDRRF